MEPVNPTAPIPPASPQPVVPLPTKTSGRHWLLWLAAGLAVLTFGITIGLFSAKFLNQSQSQPQLASTPTPAQSPTPTPSLIADWKTYSNDKFGFSFKHPGLHSTCCNISGPVIGKPGKVVVLADLQTTTMGTDKPFNGLGIFVDSTEIDLAKEEGFSSYLYGQKNSLLENYREFVGKESTSPKESPITVGEATGVKLTGYAWWGEVIYVPLPNKQKVLVIVKTESSKGNFDESFDLILSTFKFTDETLSAPVLTVNTKKLTYFLPSDWRTITDTGGILRAGYDPNQFSATPGNKSIYLNNISYPVSAMSLALKPYDGGSRHQFIYNQLGYTAAMAQDERMDNYYEKEYQYGDWNCLVLYGLGYSARGTTWGMCAINSSQALFIEGGSEANTEQLISTTKLIQSTN